MKTETATTAALRNESRLEKKKHGSFAGTERYSMNFAIGLPMIVQVDKTCSNLLKISVSPIILRPGSCSKANFSSGNTVFAKIAPAQQLKTGYPAWEVWCITQWRNM